MTQSNTPSPPVQSSTLMGNATPAISRCGLPLPLPATFATDAHMARPADVAPAPHWDLSDINKVNVRIERDNKASIAVTEAYAAARNSPNSVGALDVGDNLKPFFAYTDEDTELLVKITGVAEATGLLPTFMTLWIAAQRLKIARTDAEKKEQREMERARAARPMCGSVTMGPLHRISSTSDALVPIPECYENSLCLKIYFPLHCWIDKQLQAIADQPHSIPKTDVGETRLTVVDVAKAERTLGTDDFSALTPGLWRQASVNQLRAFENICAAPVPGDPNSPVTSYAIEYKKHIQFFAGLHCFEEPEMFEAWFRLEAALRAEIFNNGVFDTATWESIYGSWA
ncbi:hypothetical protein C8R45DRAFT_938105 [Mycena sanguinolenta]|nr:hypothetical protein C8R45DRAFT_938105 [Mycena sanguinolenta]